MPDFEAYVQRKITSLEPFAALGWHVKIYTITNLEVFSSKGILDEVLASLPDWLAKADTSYLPTYKTAFLIVHEAREGVWILLSWWTGGEMLETLTRFVQLDSPIQIQESPYKNSLVCVWELQIIQHEREAWIKHILSSPSSPDFENYNRDLLIL